MQSLKSLGDHQVSELKKRIAEIEASCQTYKSQLAQQKQLEAQQNQINSNEIQKLENMIEQFQREATQQEAEQEELELKFRDSEQENLTLNKKVVELMDQVKLGLKEKEDVGMKASQLEEKVQKMELLLEQTNLTKNQMSK